MSQQSLIPAPLAAAIFYLERAQLSALAQQLEGLWQRQDLQQLSRELFTLSDEFNNGSYSNDSHELLGAALQELKHLEIFLKGISDQKHKKSIAKGHVLVVCHKDEFRKKITYQLEQDGHHVRIAKDSVSAEDALIRQYSGLIIIDIAIDQIGGLALLDKLKAHSVHKHTPILVLSKTPNTALAAQAIEKGAFDFLSPPFSGALFNARIRAAVDESQQRESDQFEQRQAARKHNLIHQLAGRYLNHAVVDKLLSRPGAAELGGELREVTLLMCDMRKFSTIAESLAPQQVVTLLNNYLGTMTEVVHEHGGIVNEFEGDSLLAIFNAPLPLHEHTVAALSCAVAMQQAVEQVNEMNHPLGLPDISIGIGVVRGEVVVGNMGSERRMKFGVVGSSVNLSARLQSVAAGGEIVALASQLKEGSGGAKILRTGHVLPKGFAQEMEVAVLVAPE